VIKITLRSPIVAVLGHVDHGKTLLLDRIRGTSVAEREAGAITQHVGASFIPIEVIKKKCADLIKKYKFELTIPGLLFIDTPGHEAFTNLRKRGGSIADIAILVIDITQGIQPQTKEAIEILKINKVPFIVAANKIDLINGWLPKENKCFLDTSQEQRQHVIDLLEQKIYELIAQLSEEGFNAERFDRVKDFTKEVIIIPVSAKTGEGIQELLLFVSGLAQKFMKKKLEIDLEKPAKGNVLEVKEVQGLGMTIDAIIYEGCIKKGDEIALIGKNGIIKTKIRALLLPQPLEEIRETKKKFKTVEKVYAAAGLKIAAPGLENALAGSPLRVIRGNEQEVIKEIKAEVEDVIIEKESLGIIIKADALGSLEALVKLFEQLKVPVKKADVGVVTKKDVLEAASVKKENPLLGVIIAFNTQINDDAKEEAEKEEIPIFESKVIYKLEEDYLEWKKKKEEEEKEKKLEKYVFPAKLKVLPGFVFRASKPAIIGVEVISGVIKPKYPLMNEKGSPVGKILGIQSKNQAVGKAEKGEKVAISIDNGVVGRNIKEGGFLYTNVPYEQLYELIEFFEDQELIKEIRKIKERCKK